MSPLVVPTFWVPLEANGIDLGPLLPHHFSEFVVGILLMIVIWVVMAKVVVPKFEAVYAERANAIQGGLERAEKAEEAAQAALSEYNNQLAMAREEAAQIREQAKSKGTAIIAEAKETAADESMRITERARAQIAAERSQAMASLRGEVGGLAAVLAGKIVGEALADDARVQRTVDRFLNELEDQQVGQKP